MPIGALLREAREQSGLSAAEISERTRIQLYKIEALESGDFVHLPDGVYLDGIVRAYARELGLEPGPLIERLHRERPPVAQDWVAVLKGIYASRQRKGRGREPWKPITIDLPKAPVRRKPARPAHRSGSLFALALISLCAAIGWSLGLYLHELTRPPVDQILATEQPPAESSPVVGPAENAGTAATLTLADSGGTAASVPDVSGSWMLLTLPERSRAAGLTGSRHDYELYLEQNGERVTGSGRKVSENGYTIGSSSQTSISVVGTIHAERLTLAFTERGTRRASGKFVLLLEGNATMRGRFASTASQPSGIVEARRLP